MSDLFTQSGATFSDCRKWRYKLWRIWDTTIKPMNVIALNPSTADERLNDPTITRCITRATAGGYGGLIMTNIFAFRATDPRVMKAYPEPIGPDNDAHLIDAANSAGIVIAAWGTHGEQRNPKRPDLDRRGQKVLELLRDIDIFALRFTKAGGPSHPLYLPAALQPIIFRPKKGDTT